MRILIVHPLLEVGGGAEKLALEMHRALTELGFDSEIVTFYLDDKRLWEAVELLTPDFKPRITVKPLPLAFRLLESTLRFISGERMVRLRRALLASFIIRRLGERDGLIIDTASHLPTGVDIAYVHVPLTTPSGRKGVVWRVYEYVVRKIADSITGSPRLVLVNSTWTQEVFTGIYGNNFKVGVLYPPVDVEYFKGGGGSREKLIVTVSRLSPEKNLDRIIEAASSLRDYEFYVIGSATKRGLQYASTLLEKARSMGLDNLHVEINMPREKLRDVLWRASFYLHPPYAEHFGLSVAEATAAGAIPIVYKDGGAWTDIVSRINPILGYESISEVPGIVKEIDKDPWLTREIREKGLSIVEEFSYARFKERLERILSTML